MAGIKLQFVNRFCLVQQAAVGVERLCIAVYVAGHDRSRVGGPGVAREPQWKLLAIPGAGYGGSRMDLLLPRPLRFERC